MIIGNMEVWLRLPTGTLQRDIDQARSAVGSGMGHIERSVASAMGNIAGQLAVAFSAAQFIGFIKGAIDAVDALNDMSVRTKVAITDLSGLAYAAKLGDTSLEGVASAINKLGTNIGKDGAKFRELGITATDPLEAFKQLADIFKDIQDPQQRAAFGAEALGKSWQDAAVLLDGGSAGITELINKGKELSGVTEQVAADAGAFNDKLDMLGFAVQGVGTRLAADLLPMLTMLVDDLTATSTSATDVSDSFSPVVEALRAVVILGGNVGFVLKTVGTELGGMAAQLGLFLESWEKLKNRDLKGSREAFTNALLIGDEMKADAKKSREAFDAWEQGWLTVGKVAKETRADIAEPFPDPYGIDAKVAEEKAAKVVAFLKTTELDAARKKAESDALAAQKATMTGRLDMLRYGIDVEKNIRTESVAAMVELNRQGLASDEQLYTARYQAALKAGADTARAKQAEIEVLKGFRGKDLSERIDNENKIKKLTAESAEAMRGAAAAATALSAARDYDRDKPARDAEDVLKKEVAAIYEQVDAVEQQIAAFGKLPEVVTAAAIAQLEESKASLIGFEENEKAIAGINRKIEALGKLADKQKTLSGLETGSDVAKAKELLEILTAVDAAARQAASGMSESFGRVGTAIGGLTTALSGYAVQQQTIAAQLAAVKADPKSGATKIAQAEIAASKASAQAQMKSYGDIAGAAKGFFKENTAGYKLMQGTEKAFRAAEMAMAIESMLTKSGLVTAFTGLFVASKATEVGADTAATGTSIANSLLRATASTIAGVAKAFEQMGVYGFIGAAAIIAFMAGMGSGASGGGGAAPTTFEDRQKKQGTGTVLGDDTAKSESIANSLAIIEANSSLELNYQNDMLQALKNIESALGGAAKGIFQTAGLTGGSAFGTANESTKSFFGADKSTTITDTGVKFSGSLGDLRAGAGKGIQYEDVTKTSDGGWFHGNSSSNSTNTKALSDAALKPFTLIFDNMGDLLVGAGVKLGADSKGLTDAINQITIDFAVSTRDLKGQDLVDALSAGVSVAFDQVTTSVFPQIAQFQKVGEGMGETLVRVASNYAAVNSILATSGVTFGQVGMDSIAAREKLIDFAGGIDEFASKQTSFNDNFLNESERLAPVQKYVTDQLAAMGLQGIDTRDKFKETVLGLANSGALATEAGAKQYAGLLDLADAFAKVYAATEDVTMSQQEIADQRKELQDQYDELTMTSAQLRDKEALTIHATNKALWDKIQVEQAAKDAVATNNSMLANMAAYYQAVGNKAGMADIAGKQWLATLIAMDPALRASATLAHDAQLAQAAAAVQASENSSMWSSMAALAATTGDKLSASIVAQWQFEDSIKDLSPVAKDWAILANNAKIKQQAANEKAEEYSKLLSYQAAEYAATGNTAAAAAVSQKQFELSMKDLTPALKAAAAATREAEAAAKALGSQKSIRSSLATEDMKVIEAQAALDKGFSALKLSVPKTVAEFLALSDGASTTTKAGRDLIAALELLAPSFNVVQTAAEKAAKEAAELAEKTGKEYEEAREKAAEKNKQDAATLLDLQGQYYEITGNKAGAASVLERQHAAALLEMVPALQAASRAVWAATAAAEAQAKQLEKLKTAANDAFAVLGKAVDAEKAVAKAALDAQVTLLNAQKSSARAMLEAQAAAAQAAIDIEKEKNSNLASLASSLKSALASMSLPADFAGDWAAARQQLDAALTSFKLTGIAPNADALADALKTVTQDSEDRYETYLDYENAQRKTTAQIEELNALTGTQLSTSDKTLLAAEAQLKALQDAAQASDVRYDEQIAAAQAAYDLQISQFDAMMASAQARLDAMNGTTIAVKSVEAGLSAFNSSVLAAIAGVQAAQVRDAVLAGGGAVPSVGGGAQPALPGLPSAPEVEAISKVQALLAVYQKYSSIKGNELYGGREIRAVGATELELAQAKDLFINGSHANGLGRVPFDGYIGELHRDEAVLTAPQARAWREGGSDALVVEIRALRTEVAELRRTNSEENYAIAKSNLDIADTLDDWDGAGMPHERTEVAA